MFVSARDELPEMDPRSREPRTDGPGGDAERERAILVAEISPGAERKHLLLGNREAVEDSEHGRALPDKGSSVNSLTRHGLNAGYPPKFRTLHASLQPGSP